MLRHQAHSFRRPWTFRVFYLLQAHVRFQIPYAKVLRLLEEWFQSWLSSIPAMLSFFNGTASTSMDTSNYLLLLHHADFAHFAHMSVSSRTSYPTSDQHALKVCYVVISWLFTACLVLHMISKCFFNKRLLTYLLTYLSQSSSTYCEQAQPSLHLKPFRT